MKIILLIRLWLYQNHYRFIAVVLTRQNELGTDPKTIQQIEFVGQLKDPDNEIVANGCMFLLTKQNLKMFLKK